MAVDQSRSAMQRLFEAQARPASPGITPADIQSLLEAAALAEQAAAQAPMQNAVADGGGNWWDPRPEVVQGGQEMNQRNTPPGMSAPPPPLLGNATPHTAQTLPSVNAPTPPPTPSSQPGVTGSGVTTNTNPEALLEPMMQGSAVQPAQEATQFQAQMDPSTGEAVFQAPGVQGQIRVPLTMGLDEAQLHFQGMGDRWSGTDSFGPNAAVSRDRASQMYREWLRLREGAASSPQGQPTGPLTQTQIDFSQTAGGPVSPENAARLQAAQLAERQAQAGADRTALGEVATRAGAFGGRADLLAQQAQQQAQQEQQFQTELRDRMGRFEGAIREVASRRVDPNRYFGPGAGGRIGAALAVAIGEIGGALTGRPNAALGIIESAINRDMQAQQSDNENARAAANMQGTAIQQMRSIIGDERGAQAAVRAAHYQAFMNQIDQQLTTASGANLQSLQVLRAAVLERIQAEQAVAADRASMTVTQRVSTQERHRGGSTAVDAAGAAATQQMARQQPQAAPGAPTQAQTPSSPSQPAAAPTALERVQQGNLFQEEGEIEIAPGVRIPGIGAAPVSTPGARMAVDAARARLRRNPGDRGARETVRAAERETRADARRFERRARAALPRLQPFDSTDIHRVLTRMDRWAAGGSESGAPLPAVLPPGYRWLTQDDGVPNGPDLYRNRIRLGAESERELLTHTRMLNILNDALPSILGARREFQGEATSVERRVQLAQQMARNFRGVLQQSRSGATLTTQEIEMYQAMLPDPDTITVANVLGLWDRVEGAWTTFADMYGTASRSVLRNFGITTDNTAGNARQREQALGRARDEETDAAIAGGPEESASLIRQIITRNRENQSREGN